MDDPNVGQAAGGGYVNPLQMQSQTDPFLTQLRMDPTQVPAYGLQGLQGNPQGVGQAMLESPNAVLQRILQYDPNARLQSYSDFGDSGGGVQQQVMFDQSLLPKPQVAGLSQIMRDTPLYNPQATYNDPNYGRMTVEPNINRAANRSSALDWAGPLAVGLFTGGLGGFSALGSALGKLPNVASMASGMMQGGGAGISPQQLALMRILSLANRG